MDEQESELVRRVKAKDSDALAEYISYCRPQLLNFIDKNLRPALRAKVEPDDILQEVSVSAMQGIEKAEFDQREPFSWLCQLCERRIVDANRHYFGAQKRSADREVALGGSGSETKPGLVDMLIASFTTPSQAFSRNIKEVRLAEAIQQLPEQQREALRLRYVDNLPSKEIASRIGKSDAATRVLLTRSLKKLQEIMGEL